MNILREEKHDFNFLGFKISLHLFPDGQTLWALCLGNKVLSEGHSAFFNTALSQALTEANNRK